MAVQARHRERRNALNKLVKQYLASDEEKWYNEKAKVMEKAAAKGDSETLYDTLRSLTGKRQGVSESLKRVDGSFLKGKAEKLERWAQYFEQLLNRPEPNELDDDLFDPDNDDDEIILLPDGPPTQAEIDKAVLALKLNKAAGIDDIPPKAFKFGGARLNYQLLELFRLVWAQNNNPPGL